MANDHDRAVRLSQAFVLAEEGKELTRLRMRRKFPQASESEIDEMLAEQALARRVASWTATDLRVIPGPGRFASPAKS